MISKSYGGDVLSAGSGIETLMGDFGCILAGAHGAIRVLGGGGNPAHIPERQALRRSRMAGLTRSPLFASDGWHHGHGCIRLSFAMEETDVREGIAIPAEEAGRGYEAG